MTDGFDASVTAWIQDLKSGDDEAARQIWERYFPRLLAVAGRRLGAAPRRVVDEEDVAVSVFHSLCRGAAAGRFDDLSDRDELWKLLVAITGMKAVDQVRRQMAAKRGADQVRGHSVLQPANNVDLPFADSDPTPEFLVLMEEKQRALFELLPNELLVRVARDRLEGYSNEDIADRLGVSVRTVERKLQLIRDIWSTQLEDSEFN